ncbi:hypothetical protein B0T16DRAFT_321564 [Cercophora newfieldiana]|uniref:Malate dehydrogenase n=1 Tax=Cercophora newfieldiana TaxID=92897 RepID=A0AA39YFM5_9PEZI|nr:hypothetical protein B0T16DRAFT_321564 [Cercophora newfieldiana]
MQLSTLLLSALSATVVYGAPSFPDLNLGAASPDGIETMTEYFTMLAAKVQQSRLMSAAPVCDLSKAVMPEAPVPLPAVSKGLTLKHVAIGRGTQNYTCDLKNATAVPVANGALATLFNASCIVATYPDLAKMLGRVSLRFSLTQSEASRKLAPSNLIISGKHFFTNATTPFFTLDSSPEQQLGEVPCAKEAGTPAPADAPVGQKGEAAVPWLKLKARVGATGDLQEVYRVETVGGSAPADCKGMPAAFEVEYATQYVDACNYRP